MKILSRLTDAIQLSNDMEWLHTVSAFPVRMICTDQPIVDDINVDLVWEISRSNGIIQLRDLIPLDILYMVQHSGNVGNTWKEHHFCFAKFIHQYSPENVIEIGGGHGVLSVEYGSLNKNTSWTIIDPTPNPVSSCTATFVKQLFDTTYVPTKKNITVVHSHVFEHIYDPLSFMSHLKNILSVGDRLIFSVPNLREMLYRKYTNCINFEHTLFLTEPYIDYLLTTHGFEIITKELFKEDHSIFYSAIRKEQVPVISLPAKLYDYNKALYQEYVRYHSDLILQLNEFLIESKQLVYLFGAHIFSQYLIKEGLNTDSIVCILDNDPIKQGKRLYGTSLMVSSPNILENELFPVVVLKAGSYNEEIISQLLSINPTVIIV
jgi:2-polyprenyl-3-methyl-5-hydroxy-6-metoxy-1,4-benzoquinol methylase